MNPKLLFAFAALALWSCSSDDSGRDTVERLDLSCIPMLAEESEPGASYTLYIDPVSGETILDSDPGTSLFSDGVALTASFYGGDVAHNGYHGYYYVDKSGNRIIDECYVSATVFRNGMAWTAKPNGRLTAIDKSGNKLFVAEGGEEAFPFYEGLSLVFGSNGCEVYTAEAGEDGSHVKFVLEEYSAVLPRFINGLLLVMDPVTNKWGAVDTDGYIVIPCDYDRLGFNRIEKRFYVDCVGGLNQNRILARKGNKWGVIDRNGNILINPQFDELIIDGDMYVMKKGDRYGWCSVDGSYIINPQFRDVFPFGAADMAAAKSEDGDWGFIDRSGSWVIDPQFDRAKAFTEYGVAPARLSYEWGLVDRNGKWVVNPQFREIYAIDGINRFVVQDSSCSYGIVDNVGKYVVQPNFDEVGYKEFENEYDLNAPSMLSPANSDCHKLTSKQLNCRCNDISGKSVSIAELLSERKWVLVTFWATWCPCCSKEVPYLLSAYEKYSDKGLEIYGVSIDAEDKDDIWRKYVEEQNLRWVNVRDDSNNMVELYNVGSIPSNFLISPDGYLMATDLRNEALDKVLSELLN